MEEEEEELSSEAGRKVVPDFSIKKVCVRRHGGRAEGKNLLRINRGK